MKLTDAVKHINKHKICLVFPIKNNPEILSLWKCFYPRAKMKWEWDDSADNRVAKLWHLREEMASSRKIVYAKWYKGRATLLSKDIFVNMLALFEVAAEERIFKYKTAERIYDALEDNSPLSTKQIKKECDLAGKFMLADFNRSTKELWESLKIVGVGEKDDGAFPSLLVGASKLMHEELWAESKNISTQDAYLYLHAKLGKENKFFHYIQKLLAQNPRDVF